jgi:DNA mismatch endonuclease Vsr
VRINQEHALAVRGREAYETHARRCGTALIEAKKLLKHGEWMPWLKKNCEFAYSTAVAYMILVEEVAESNLSRERDLPPRTQRQVFADRRAARGVRHGCFWHGCRRCTIGHVPKSRLDYWLPKIARNCARDVRTRRALQRAGYGTMWIWEHDLRGDAWVARLRKRLR